MPRGPDCDWCGADADDMDVYTVSGGDEFVCQDCYERLTEAAPDLLVSLKQAAIWIDEYCDLHREILPSLHAAIAKAEGRSDE